MAAKKDEKAPFEEDRGLEKKQAEKAPGFDDLSQEKKQDADAASEVVEKDVVVPENDDWRKNYPAERERQARQDRLAQHQQETREATGAPVENPETAARQHQAEREAEKKD